MSHQSRLLFNDNELQIRLFITYICTWIICRDLVAVFLVGEVLASMPGHAADNFLKR
jgi:hypothetical protein